MVEASKMRIAAGGIENDGQAGRFEKQHPLDRWWRLLNNWYRVKAISADGISMARWRTSGANGWRGICGSWRSEEVKLSFPDADICPLAWQ